MIKFASKVFYNKAKKGNKDDMPFDYMYYLKTNNFYKVHKEIIADCLKKYVGNYDSKGGILENFCEKYKYEVGNVDNAFNIVVSILKTIDKRFKINIIIKPKNANGKKYILENGESNLDSLINIYDLFDTSTEVRVLKEVYKEKALEDEFFTAPMEGRVKVRIIPKIANFKQKVDLFGNLLVSFSYNYSYNFNEELPNNGKSRKKKNDSSF